MKRMSIITEEATCVLNSEITRIKPLKEDDYYDWVLSSVGTIEEVSDEEDRLYELLKNHEADKRKSYNNNMCCMRIKFRSNSVLIHYSAVR